MTKKKKLSQEMIDAYNIVIAKQKIASLGLDPEDIMPKLQAKMGQYACTFVNEAMYPGYLCNRTGEPFQKSKALISTYANETISDERLAKALGAKTKKEAEAKTIKIQEAATRYLAKKDWQAVVDNNAIDFKQEAEEKQQQAVLRITRRENTEATQSAVLKVERTTTKAPEKETAEVSTPDPVKDEPVATTSQKLPFTFEPVNPEIAPWLKQTTAVEAPVQTAPEQETAGNGTPLDPLRDKAREELARLKAGKEGELTLDELMQSGVTNKDMGQVITKEKFGEIHAGPTAKNMANNCIKNNGSGYCARGYGKAERDTTGVRYQDLIPSLKKNGSNMEQAWKEMKNRVYFTFDSDKKNGNPEIDTCDIGTSVNFDGAAKRTYRNGKLVTQPDGHVSTKGTNGRWYSDHDDNAKNPNWLCGTSAANRYGDKYNVSWYTDCTASDKLAEDIIYQKLIREEREKEASRIVLAQNER